METSGAAKVAARITVEVANTPAVIVEAGQLNEIFELEEAAHIDPDPLNEMFKVEEAA